MNRKDIAMKLDAPDLSDAKKLALVIQVFDIIKEELLAGGKITITEFGRLEIREHKAKKGWDISTNKPCIIPPKKHLRFVESKNIKKLLNPK